MTDDFDIPKEQVAEYGNLLLMEFLDAGFPHPVDTLPEECQNALRQSNPETFTFHMVRNGYLSEYPTNRASSVIYALYMWYHKVFN